MNTFPSHSGSSASNSTQKKNAESAIEALSAYSAVTVTKDNLQTLQSAVESTENKIRLFTNTGGQVSTLNNYSEYLSIKAKVNTFVSNKNTSKTNANNAIDTVKNYLENEDLSSSSNLTESQYTELKSYYSEANSSIDLFTSTYGASEELKDSSSLSIAKSLLSKYETSTEDVITKTYTYDLQNNNTVMKNSWGTSYKAHQLTSGMFLTDTPNMFVDFSSTMFPGSSSAITDCPVVKDGTITIDFPNSTVNSLTIKLKQWNNLSKTVLVYYYNTSGTKTYFNTYSSFVGGTLTMNLTSLPSGTSKILLDFSSNTNQVGLASITAKLSTKSNKIIVNDYYASVNSTYKGEVLWSVLETLISNTQRYTTTYSDLRYLSVLTDADPKNEGYLLDFYSELSVPGEWNSDIWNREHVWCQSNAEDWFDGITNTDANAGSDIHHLRPTLKSINSKRNNHLFGVVKSFTSNKTLSTNEEVSYTYNGVTKPYGQLKIYSGEDLNPNAGSTEGVFEPLDSKKGDVARIFMYILTRYKDVIEEGNYSIIYSVYTPERTVKSVYDLLLAWHESDPVDQIEINRNHQAYLLQGNRNPFIDNPDYASLIWENLK